MLFPRAIAHKLGEFQPVVAIALFFGVGLLISILAVTLDQYLRTSAIHTAVALKTRTVLEEVQATVDVNKLTNLEFEDQSFVFSTPTKP